MNNVKIVYFNTETIEKSVIENALFSNSLCVSHIEIKSGLFLINFRGTAHEMYDSLAGIVGENSILIHDLEASTDAYWGFMNKEVWEWLRNNRH